MSLLIPVQFALILFILFAASRAYLRFKGGNLQFGAFLFWLGIWGAAAIAIFLPEETSKIAKWAGIGRGADIIIYTSIALLFYLVFRLHVMLESQHSEVSRLIREIALKEVVEKKRK